MRIVGYLRASTQRQADEGLGLEVQEQAIRAWAVAEGHKLVACYGDGGVSGADGIDARVGLHEALAALAAGRAGGLVVYRLDRLAGDLPVQEGILAWVWNHGGRVFACDAGEVRQEDPEDPARTAMRQVVGVWAQLERGTTAARMQAGRRRKAARGGFAYGAPPYGKRAVHGELVDDPAEQQVIARIRELHAAGMSLRQIARTLDAEGVRPRRGGAGRTGRWPRSSPASRVTWPTRAAACSPPEADHEQLASRPGLADGACTVQVPVAGDGCAC